MRRIQRFVYFKLNYQSCELCTKKTRYFLWQAFRGPKTSQYLVWALFASRSATHLLHIEFIRLLIVACGMLVHSSSMAVRSCLILAGTGTRRRIRRSIASQTRSMGGLSGEYAGHARTGMFSASKNCVQILATWGQCIIMLQHEVIVVDEWHNNGPQDLVTVVLRTYSFLQFCLVMLVVQKLPQLVWFPRGDD